MLTSFLAYLPDHFQRIRLRLGKMLVQFLVDTGKADISAHFIPAKWGGFILTAHSTMGMLWLRLGQSAVKDSEGFSAYFL